MLGWKLGGKALHLFLQTCEGATERMDWEYGQFHANGLRHVMMDTAEEVQVFRIRTRLTQNPEGQRDDNLTLYHRLAKN